MAGLALGAAAPAQAAETGLQPDGTIIVGPAAAKVIGDYLAKVSGRFGALAISRDGQSAAYYICQSRLWKNCDDYSLEDSFISIPSGHLAATRGAALPRLRRWQRRLRGAVRQRYLEVPVHPGPMIRSDRDILS